MEENSAAVNKANERSATIGWPILAIVGIVAFAARVVYVFEYRGCPFFDHPVIDAETYLIQAYAIARGDLLGLGPAFNNGAPYWQPPGYPFFLSIFIKLLDLRYLWLRTIGALIGAGTAVMTSLIAARVFGRKSAIIAGFAVALYGPLIFFETDFLAVGLLTLLLTTALLMIVTWREKWWWGLPTGLVIGLGVIVRPTAFFIAPVALWAVYRRAGFSRKVLLPAYLLILGMALPMIPITARNAIVGNESALVSTNAGLNFYIGNHPDKSLELKMIRPGRDWMNLAALPHADGVTKWADKSNWFFDQTFEAIAGNPAGWLKLKLFDAATFLNGHEIMRNLDPYFMRRFSTLLSALMWEKVVSFPLGLVLPLALVGMIMSLKRTSETVEQMGARPLIIFTIIYSAGVVAFFTTSRYRLPVAPALISFAAFAAVEILRMAKAGGAWTIAPYAAAFPALIIFSNLPQFRANLYLPGENEFLIANTLYDKGHQEKADEFYEVSLKKWPDNAEAWLRRGNIALYTGKTERAVELYDKAIAVDPTFERAYANRGVAKAYLRRFKDARKDFLKALELSPDWDVPKKALDNLKSMIQEGDK